MEGGRDRGRKALIVAMVKGEEGGSREKGRWRWRRKQKKWGEDQAKLREDEQTNEQ